ncbi:unnamed protein product [Clavelina lepadiformis]|uniref:Uncharacterized protein n=1 Tax=Clavelina lepadiformis TaxID=159417 RepID=A0ABP0FFB8_CLALP
MLSLGGVVDRENLCVEPMDRTMLVDHFSAENPDPELVQRPRSNKMYKTPMDCIPECVPTSEDWNAVSDSTATTVCCYLHVQGNKTEFGSSQTGRIHLLSTSSAKV